MSGYSKSTIVCIRETVQHRKIGGTYIQLIGVKVEVKGSGNYQQCDKNVSTWGEVQNLHQGCLLFGSDLNAAKWHANSLYIKRNLTPLVEFSQKCGCCPAFVIPLILCVTCPIDTSYAKTGYKQ